MSGVSNRTLTAVGAAAVTILAIAGFFAPVPVLHGWLIGFTAVGGVALGAAACLAIHALTGGRWGEVGRPSFLGGALTIPALIVLGLPLVLLARHLYPWAADPGAAGEGVAALVLNPTSVGLRSLVLLAVLTGFALLARRGPLGTLAAGLCLVVYAVGMDVAAFDWVLSLDPRFDSSAFGAQLIIQQIASAYAVAILCARAPDDDPAWGDLGALLLASVLGGNYLVLMTYLIDWYGDLPDQARHFLMLSHGTWRWVLAGAVGVGAAGPILALLMTRVRRRPSALRVVAVAVLAGVLLEDIWLIAPQAGALGGRGGLAMAAGLVACAGFAGLMLRLGRHLAARSPPDRSVAHGA